MINRKALIRAVIATIAMIGASAAAVMLIQSGSEHALHIILYALFIFTAVMLFGMLVFIFYLLFE